MPTQSTIADIREGFAATAVYPKQCESAYLTAGLISELGELANVIKKVVRGDRSTADAAERIVDEYGDICWYAVMRSNRTPQDLGYGTLAADAAEFREELRAADSLGDPLRGNATAACEYLADAMLQLLEAERADVQIVSDLGVVLSEFLGRDDFLFDVACSNVASKLRDRQQRGVLRGDGDHR